MKIPTRQACCSLFVAVSIGLAATAALAFGDCNRAGRVTDTALPVSAELHTDSAVSLADPALDGLVARYADLHRAAVGYAFAGVTGTPVYARAATESGNPVAR